MDVVQTDENCCKYKCTEYNKKLLILLYVFINKILTRTLLTLVKKLLKIYIIYRTYLLYFSFWYNYNTLDKFPFFVQFFGINSPKLSKILYLYSQKQNLLSPKN